MPAVACTICSEIYTNADVIYSTQCGHIFHFSCMQQWRSRSTSCPQCREHNPTSHRIFLDFDETANEQQLIEVKTNLDQTEKARSELQLQLDENERNLYDMQRLLVESEERKIDLESTNEYLKAQNNSREEEINKLVINGNLKASEEAELLRVQLSSLEERLKEVLLDFQEKNEECLRLYEENNKQAKLLERNNSLFSRSRSQYEAIERGLRVKIEHLSEVITQKTAIIEKQQNTISGLTADSKSFQKNEFQMQMPSQYNDMLTKKLNLERDLEKSMDKILELEEGNSRTVEMLNLEIENLKSDIERKESEIKNRKDIHAKMMERLGQLGSKATENSLRKRNEVLSAKLEETRCELEKAFKSSAQKDAAIQKLHQTDNLLKSNFNSLVNNTKIEEECFEKKPSRVITKSLEHTPSLDDKNEVRSGKVKTATSILLKGVPEDDIKLPLIDTVFMYFQIMNLPFTAADITSVSKLNSRRRNNNQNQTMSLKVKFTTLNLKTEFLMNKEKLKPRGIHASEFVENEKFNLFIYAKYLRTVGYKYVFLENNNVIVKRNQNAPKIKISKMEEVSDLIEKSKNEIEVLKEQNHKNEREKVEVEKCDNNYYRL